MNDSRSPLRCGRNVGALPLPGGEGGEGERNSNYSSVWGSGPKMKNRSSVGCALNRPVMNAGVGGGDETFEQRVRRVRFALKFRMKLAGQVKWVVRQFDNLHKFFVDRSSRKHKSGFLEFLPVIVVEFV